MDMMQEVCRLVVDVGGYRMAWVGYRVDDADKSVQPVAHAGFEQGYLDTARITWDAESPRGLGPVALAIRAGQPQVVQDVQHDPCFVPWKNEALERGYGSIVALPLTIDGETIGAVNIYASESQAFLEDEIHLLMELAGNLAYGVRSLRLEEEKHRALEHLQASEKRLSQAFNVSPDAIVIISLKDEHIVDMNERFVRFSGYSRAELMGKSSLELGLCGDRAKREKVLALAHHRLQPLRRAWLRPGQAAPATGTGGQFRPLAAVPL